MNGNHSLVDAVSGSQYTELFEFVGPGSTDTNLLPRQSNMRSNLAGSERQSLQPCDGGFGELVRADNQDANRPRQVSSASVDNAEHRVKDDGKSKESD